MNDNENEIYKIYQEQINDRDKIIYYLIDKSEKENEKNRKFVLIIIGIIAIIFTVAILFIGYDKIAQILEISVVKDLMLIQIL